MGRCDSEGFLHTVLPWRVVAAGRKISSAAMMSSPNTGQFGMRILLMMERKILVVGNPIVVWSFLEFLAALYC